MNEYDLKKMRSAIDALKDNWKKSYERFCAELQKVPAEYYRNIFFPETAADEPVIITGIRLSDGILLYDVGPAGEPEKKKTFKGDESQAIFERMARNIVGAIEVAEIDRKRAETVQEEIRHREEEISLAEKRRNAQ